MFTIVKDVMTSEVTLNQYLLGRHREHGTKGEAERQLKEGERMIAELLKTKRNALELYAKGDISREVYRAQCKQYDDDIKRAKDERNTVLGAIPILHKEDVVDASLRHYCGTLKTRLATAVDFDSQRQLLLEYIEKVVFLRDKMELHGAVPILLSASSDAKNMSFVVACTIPPKYRTLTSSRKRERASDFLRVEILPPMMNK